MGEEAGPLLEGLCAYRPSDIIELYTFAKLEMPPRRFLYVFGDSSVDAQHYFLDTESPTDAFDCEVVRTPFGVEAWRTDLSRRFMSLREMLFFQAVENVCLPIFTERASYYMRTWETDHALPATADAVARVLENSGFARLPFPRHNLIFERADAIVGLYRSLDEPGIAIDVGMRDSAELRRLEAILEDNTAVARL